MSVGFEDQLSTLETLAAEISDLKKTKRDESDLEQRMTELNTRVSTVQDTVDAVKEQRENLQQWVSLAEAMNKSASARGDLGIDSIEIDRAEIEDTLDGIREQLQQIMQLSVTEVSTKEDIPDPDYLREIDTTLKQRREELQSQTDTVRTAVQVRCGTLINDSVEPKQTALQIPDVGSRSAERTLRQFKEYLQGLRNTDVVTEASVDAWNQKLEQYSAVEITLNTVQERYGLSDEAIGVVESLLDDTEVTLGDVPAAVFIDLQELDEFSQKIQFRFTDS
jgi:chromosome segregation ATPase